MDHLTNLSMGVEFRPQYYDSDNQFDPAKHNFHSFPATAGYYFDERQELQPRESGKVTDINTFLQSWLFFGLIATVVQFPANEPFFPGHFLSEDGSQIDTSNLFKEKMYLEKWKEYEIKNKDDRTIRMIRAQVALDRAREVVQNHCSMDGKCYREGRVHEELSLSLMVLGETLSNAKSKIVEEISFNIRGWHGDATEGWGHPQCLISKMELAGWCPRTLHVLKGQLNSSATSMLSAYKSHADSGFLKPGSHPNCKAEEPCLVVSADDKGVYKTQHHVDCPDYAHPEGKKCRMIGPSIAKVLKEIEHDNFPLLCYQEGGGEPIKVQPYRPHDKYATISHVWADGYGNPVKNELWECQLKFFRTLFHKLPDRPHDQQFMLFWIDTLTIPVGKSEKHKKARQRAIKKIHDVYTKARYTIVIDNGLTQMGPSTNYEDTAMKILASGWMRRLWTLQEAYLSRRIYFAFKHEQLKNLDDLEDMYPKASDILTSNIPTAARNYFHNMLGPDRNARINELSSRSGYGLLASVWRAAQWRTTAHKEHETLALATLLNVEYQDSISKAGLMPDEEPQLLVDSKKKKTQEDLDEMMKDLWKIIDETCPGSIPPGIIFLSGKRNSIKGFRWAPRTWMSGEKIDYPDPLSIMTSRATLTDKGLAVTYPGFLLHTRPGRSILSTRNQGEQKEQEFHFAIDSSLLEWYVVDWGIESLSNAPIGLNTGEKNLAIILCRPRPRELPEIALLVEIEKTIKQRSLMDQKQSNTYHVLIVCRVKIRREIKESLLSQWKQTITQSIEDSEAKEDAMIFGEVLDEQQQWYVDGRPGPASMPQDVESDESSGVTRATGSGPRRSGARNKLIPQTGSSRNAASSFARPPRANTTNFPSPAVPNGRPPAPGRLGRSFTQPVSPANNAQRDMSQSSTLSRIPPTNAGSSSKRPLWKK